MQWLPSGLGGGGLGGSWWSSTTLRLRKWLWWLVILSWFSWFILWLKLWLWLIDGKFPANENKDTNKYT